MKNIKLKFFKDWNMWCCVEEDNFINIQESVAWFWDTKAEAMKDFYINKTKELWK